MSKRAWIAAIKAIPDYSPDGKTKVDLTFDRLLYQHGYEQAEKDIIERAVMWLEEHADEYNGSESAFDHMEEEMITDFRKAMEEN